MKSMIVVVASNGCPLDSLAGELTDRGVDWVRFDTSAKAIDTIGQRMPDLVILDAGHDPPLRVIPTVERIKTCWLSIPIFLITNRRSESLAIGALKAGVTDYFRSPVATQELLAGIERELLTPPGSGIRKGAIDGRIASRMIGCSRVMEDLKGLLNRVSKVDSTVLITGETGTGKELAARLIHENSPRAHRPMVSINCAALPDTLVESELFGYEQGAFTGATATSCGRFEQARGGTVFLDEIGDMTPFAQAKILRVIEDKQIARLGSSAPVPIDFRLIAATNREPEALMADGVFRNDLYYRLNVARVHMPSLREHREDIQPLVAHGIRRLNKKFNRNVKGLKKEVLRLLMRYDWHGNVRELMNVLEGAYINMPSRHIDYADLPAHFKQTLAESQHLPSDERRRILSALMATNWNKSTAAEKLKWSRMTLYRKIEQYNIVEKRSAQGRRQL